MLLVPFTTLYALPKSASTKRGPTFQKEWDSRKRPRISLPCSRPMLGAFLQLWRWYPDHPPLFQCMHLPLMPLTRNEKGPKKAKVLKVPRKEKSLNPLNSPQPKKLEQRGGNRRKTPLLGPQKNLWEIGHPSLLSRDPYSH